MHWWFSGPEVGTVVLHDQDGLNLAYFVARNPKRVQNITYNWFTVVSSYQNEDLQYGEAIIEFSSKKTCKRVAFSKVNKLNFMHLFSIAEFLPFYHRLVHFSCPESHYFGN